MCTNFDRSVYLILKRFDDQNPKSKKQVFDELYNARAKIFLGATTSFSDFVSTLKTERKLVNRESGLVLTKNGLRLRNQLAEMINKADQTPK